MIDKYIDIYYTKYNSNEWLYTIKNFPDTLKEFDSKDFKIIKKTHDYITYKLNNYYLTIGVIDQGRGDELWVTNIYTI